MKKYLLIAAVCLIAASCQKEEGQEHRGLSLSASLEQTSSVTKASLNDSRQTLWATGDVIRVYVENDAGSWNTNAPFNLTSGDGNTNAVFTCETDYSSGNKWNVGAFFPYFEESAGNGSNINSGNMYFYLPEGYYGYTTGKTYLPLIADMSGGSTQPTSISFKHVGGAVVLNLTNVPGPAHSIGMTVSGKNVFGWLGSVAVGDAGSASGILTASSGSNSTVWLNFDENGSTPRSFQFVFPVPTISSSCDYSFSMYDKNNLKIWSKTASSQPAIGRAEALVMPDKAVSPVPQEIYLAGYINGADTYPTSGNDFKFVDGTLTVSLTQDSYVLLNNNSNERYLLSAYSESTDPVTFSVDNDNYDYKLKVPSGTRTFTLTYNSDGSITLSYV